MKKIIFLLSILTLIGVYSCSNKSCKCTYSDGSVDNIKITSTEECSDYNMSTGMGSSVSCKEE
jgi:hypothetical protein